MPRKGGRLTRQELLFAKKYAEDGNQEKAAKAVGYKSASSSGSQLMQRPAVQQAIVAEQTAYLTNTLLPLAVKRLESLIINPATPANAALGAAKFVVERSLGDGKGQEGKEPHEMTGDELQGAIDRLRREASERATPVIDGKAAPIPQVAPSVLD